MNAIAQMGYESWVTILLAVLGVLLAIVTAAIAVAGLAIAVVGIWGIKGISKAAQKKADEAVTAKMAEYPQATDFLELYRNLQRQLLEFRREYDLFQRRNEQANEILVRLSSRDAGGSSNEAEGRGGRTDNQSEPISASYPGEEVPDDSDDRQ